MKKFIFKIRNNGKYNDFCVGLSTRSYINCHECDKKGHIQRYCKSNGNGSGGNLSWTPIKELILWFKNNPIISDVEFMEKNSMTCNKNN